MNKKAIVATVLFIVILLILGIFISNKFTKEPYQSDISYRGKNSDNLIVYTAEASYEIKNNTLVKNYEPVIKNIKEISLSIIDEYAFFFNNEGFVRFNLETEEKLLLNYDVMDFAAAGLNYIYYVADNDLYKLGANNFSEKVASDVYEKLFIYENSLYYIAGNICYEVDLLDDIVNEKLDIQGEIKEAVMTNRQIIIVTDNDLFRVKIGEEENEFN